jgi:hypothetical protein
VDELLAGTGEEEGSSTNSEDGEDSGSSHMVREGTVVPEHLAFHDREATIQESNPDNPHTPSLGQTSRATAINLANPIVASDLALGETPRNDLFLATLAPGVHQRLDLAQQMGRLGRDGQPVVLEEGEEDEENEPSDRAQGDEGDDGWMEVGPEEARRHSAEADSRGARGDIDMMFT